MAKTLHHLLEVYENAVAAQKLVDLRAAAAHKRTEKALAELQAACPHEDVKQTSSYHGGGYDYCASTHYSETCTLCGKLIRTWVKDHHGIYG